LKTKIEIPIESTIEIPSISSTDFKKFISNPIESFKTSTESFEKKKKNFQSFQKKYFLIKSNPLNSNDLDELIISNMHLSSDSKIQNLLNDQNLFRNYYKNEFIQEIKKIKESSSSSDFKKIRKEIRLMINQKEDEIEDDISETELSSLVYEDFFEEWVSKKSNFMNEFDKMIDFENKVKKDSRKIILELIQSGKQKIDFSEIFSEFEKEMKKVESYFEFGSKKESEMMESFIQLIDKIELVEKEISEQRKENSEQRKEISELKSLGIKETENDDVLPFDGFLIDN